MKLLKKMNLGLLLAIVAVVSIVVYSINLENSRKGAKNAIKQTCEEYIALTSIYSVLPQEYQVIGEDISKKDYSKYYTEMKNEIGKYTLTENDAEIQFSILKMVIESQKISTQSIITSVDRKIDKISSYEFDGNQVTVTFNTNMNVKCKYNEVNQENGEVSEKIREFTVNNEAETMVLECVDGKWKVVSSNLNYNTNSNININEGINY